MHVSDSGSEHEGPRARLPLNSKRLTAEQIKRVGRALDVPTDASVDEVHVMVEGKLREMEHDPANVQVVVGSAGLSLCGEDGEFLSITDPPSTEAPDEERDQEVSSDELESGGHETEQLQEELQEARAEIQTLKETISLLQTRVDQGKDRIKQMWRENCRYVAEVDDELSRKDVEIHQLQETIQQLRATATSGGSGVPPAESTPVGSSEARPVDTTGARLVRRGKAPPVDSFIGEDAETTLDDWLPSLQRAAEWNSWAENEKLMQLAGHLHGRARQEWDLLSETEKGSCAQAVQALRGKLEPVNKALAAQDFRHICQGDNESVADFIRRLERTFKIAYGRDSMSQETRNALLHGQLQDGLRYEIMKAPAVSGAQT